MVTAPDKPLIVLVGPTASGKTSLAIQIAQAFPGEIVSCDSVAVYREMEIGTAKPSHDERALVPHHMIDIAFPDEPCTAGDYSRQAREALTGITERNHLPIVAGGTGLYLRALIDGLFSAPPQKPGQRERLRNIASTRGPAYLHRLLTRLDPTAASTIHPNDVPKAVRAIEVSLATISPTAIPPATDSPTTVPAAASRATSSHNADSSSAASHITDSRTPASNITDSHTRASHKVVSSPTESLTTNKAPAANKRTPITAQWQQGRNALTGYRILRLGLNPPRPRLYERINQRAAAMFDRGLIEETERLLTRYGPDCRPLTSLGYAEATAVLRNELTREQAVAQAQQGHRNYAKRQLTWFRRDPDIHWLPGCGGDPDITQQALHLISHHLNPSTK
jgi:tRNA A37 N6-isopentenylltransferase MiaA